MDNRYNRGLTTMIRAVTHYTAPDGKTFPSDQEAQRHANEVLLHKLEDLVNYMFPNVGHRPSVIKAVELLADDRLTAAVMLREILRVLTYGDAPQE